MAWRTIYKTVKGHRYAYRQRSKREGGKVKTESVYLGPVDGLVRHGQSGVPGHPVLIPLWRVDSGYRHTRGATALDVVRHEGQELGNTYIADQVKTVCDDDILRERPAGDLVWVTRTAAEARRYGKRAERVDLPANSIVLAADRDGGLLILRGGLAPADETRDQPAKGSQPAKTTPRDDEQLISSLMEPKNAKTWRRPYSAAAEATFTESLRLDPRILNLPLALGVRISSLPWPHPWKHHDNPWYSPDDDHIQLPDPSRLPARTPLLSAHRYHQALLHELVHATAHGSRLARRSRLLSFSDDYAWEEMVAEIGSCLVLNRIGASDERVLAMSADYVQGYAARLPEYHQHQAFTAAKRAAEYILTLWPGEV